MTKPQPLDRRTLLKVYNKMVGLCACDQCDLTGEWGRVRNWVAVEVGRAKAIEKRRAKKAGKQS